MSTRSKLLALLSNRVGEFVSGQEIGEELKVSRNAIWKAIEQLKKDGYNIESKPRVGYCLKTEEEILCEKGIASFMTHKCLLKVFDTVDSTNNFAKGCALTDTPLLVVADRQTAGRGRLGRSFVSPPHSGIYMTMALKPNFDLTKSLNVTMAAAVAVTRAVEDVTGLKVKIKWVNDLFYQDKKVCGILTEAQSNFETGAIDSLIIGIGVNCFPGNVPSELESVIGSLCENPGSFSRCHLAASIADHLLDILEDFSSTAFMIEYRRKCFILGKEVMVYKSIGDKGIKARAIDIDDNGALIVEYLEGMRNRDMESLTTGEVTIRPV